MILHSVFIRFKAAIQQADKDALFAELAALGQVIPGIVEIKWGPNVSPEGLDGGFRDGFIVSFSDIDARDAYLVHPAHMALGERILSSTDGGLAGLLVFDLMV